MGTSPTDRRPWRWQAATATVGLLALAALISSIVFATQAHGWREEAQRWRAATGEWEGLAEELDEEASSARDQAEQLGRELDAAELALNESQQRVTATENALADLEGALVSAEDEAYLAGAFADELADISMSLTSCIDDTYQWLGSRPSLYASSAIWDGYWDRGFTIAGSCDTAIARFETLLR